MSIKTNCLTCGNELICRKGGTKKKMYCGRSDKVGTCLYKRKLLLDRKRRADTKSIYKESLSSYLKKLGGRTLTDLERDEEGKLFIPMWNGFHKVYTKCHLPDYLQY